MRMRLIKLSLPKTFGPFNTVYFGMAKIAKCKRHLPRSFLVPVLISPEPCQQFSQKKQLQVEIFLVLFTFSVFAHQ